MNSGKGALTRTEPAPEDRQYEQGLTEAERGHFESALEHWTAAEKEFQKEKNIDKQNLVLMGLTSVYESMGMNAKAMEVMEKALAFAKTSGNRNHLAMIFSQRGNLNLILGERDQAENDLDQSMEIARGLDDPELLASILNHLGNLRLSRNDQEGAIRLYVQSMEKAKDCDNPRLAISSQINHARASMKAGQFETAQKSLEQALSRLKGQADSHFKAYGLINIGMACRDLGDALPNLRDSFLLSSHDCFSLARDVASRLEDHRAASYALGYLGMLYEGTHRYQKALALTQGAVFSAQQVYAPESLYKWQWQAGRILKQMNQTKEAIEAYRRAIFYLQAVRQEIDNCQDNRQAGFRSIAGTIAFELVDLLLEYNRSVSNPETRQALLLEARDVVELLRVYELRNYFQDDCVDAAGFKTVSLEEVTDMAAVIYPVIFKDRLELLVSLSTGMKQVTIPVDRETLTREIRIFRSKLEKCTTLEFLPHARKLYDYLIRPLEADLTGMDADTLIFVPSGPLRTIPMAALQDGREFLIQKYATVITPGLDLIDPTPIRRDKIRVLAAGITKASQGFPPLPAVAVELRNIHALYPGKLLFDQNFLVENIEAELKKEEFNIVHIASHGQFQEDADQTFVLAFDQKLTMADIDKYAGFLQFRKTPLDLLVLSACESASGDDIAALGMAGVAVKAGARSALATLWSIHDQAAAILIREFYQQMKNPSVSRAAAIQQAQLHLMEDPRYDHPAYWSPFLLINNWL